MNTNQPERLRHDAIKETPRDFNFAEGFGETWDIVLPDVESWTADQCLKFLGDQGCEVEGDPEEVSDLREQCSDLIDGDARDQFVPIMNYAYPLPYCDLARAAAVVQDLPSCCVVTMEDDFYDKTHAYLALTCGGVDCTWEIVESYVKLGYLPPLHFCDLPMMAGRGTSESDRKLMQRCIESCESASNRALSLRDTLVARLSASGPVQLG